LDLTFFGLTPEVAPEVRIALFKNIHSIVFHSKGGYDFHTIYNMPIWLRRFTFSEIDKYYKDEAKAMEDAKKGKKGTKTLVSSDGKVNTPEFLKASKEYKGKTSYK
tara:strand:+ start:2137 stop:2454 length:318 start_codon:yes stop_codon:yes gene_type:complete